MSGQSSVTPERNGQPDPGPTSEQADPASVIAPPAIPVTDMAPAPDLSAQLAETLAGAADTTTAAMPTPSRETPAEPAGADTNVTITPPMEEAAPPQQTSEGVDESASSRPIISANSNDDPSQNETGQPATDTGGLSWHNCNSIMCTVQSMRSGFISQEAGLLVPP
jgi:hypothetical protein